MEPILASCLDIAVTKLPHPKHRFVVGLEDDETFFFNVQSMVSTLAPPGGALISIVEYLLPDARGERATLERLVDALQPGWRDVAVHTQFLPKMVVAADHPGAAEPRSQTLVPGVFGAGDGWGSEMLVDGAFEAARNAATLALGSELGKPREGLEGRGNTPMDATKLARRFVACARRLLPLGREPRRRRMISRKRRCFAWSSIAMRCARTIRRR